MVCFIIRARSCSIEGLDISIGTSSSSPESSSESLVKASSSLLSISESLDGEVATTELSVGSFVPSTVSVGSFVPSAVLSLSSACFLEVSISVISWICSKYGQK